MQASFLAVAIIALPDPFLFLIWRYLGKGEDYLTVGQEEQQPLVHVLAEQEGAFLGARGAEVEHLAAERTEVVGLTVRIGTLDPRDALCVVPAA